MGFLLLELRKRLGNELLGISKIRIELETIVGGGGKIQQESNGGADLTTGHKTIRAN